MEEFAKIWQDCANRPHVTHETSRRWDTLLDVWIGSDAPLFINKPLNNRGAVFQHRSGRLLVPTDQSPAVWTFQLAMNHHCPSFVEIRDRLRADQIPVARSFGPAERRRALYRCTQQEGLEQQGWQLRHGQVIGIKPETVLQMPACELLEHFRLFMSPANMYVLPLGR